MLLQALYTWSGKMKKLAAFLILAVLTILFFIPLFPIISFTETKTNNPQMYYIDLRKDATFQIRFTHSIHRTDVLESYEVEDGKIKMISMEYEDVAIGMPAHAEEGQKLTYEDGKYKLYSNKMVENFVLYVGDINMDLFFYYGGREYNLKKTLHRGSSYMVEAKRVSFYEKLKGVRIVHGEY
jgi:hypothetical protein